ncbi:MAG: ABC transporter permease subunit [Actinobacteria bacterium]|nr:ABC transporter permease subunit [Actinomycetota bacterium]
MSAANASLRLLGSEMHLIVGRRRNQAGILVRAAVRGRGTGFIASATSNGIFVALSALTIELALFLPLAVAVLSGDAIAGEANTGTLRYLLTVPVQRTRLLVIKYISLVIGAFVGVLVVTVAGIIAGGIFFGLGPVTLLSGDEIPLVEALGRVALAVLYITACLAGLAAIGLFVSTLTEQPIAAMITVTIISTAMWILDGISQLDWIHPWLPVHYWPSFADLFRNPMFFDSMRQGFASLAWARVAQKDITS